MVSLILSSVSILTKLTKLISDFTVFSILFNPVFLSVKVVLPRQVFEHILK